jgi:hypothetical protein
MAIAGFSVAGAGLLVGAVTGGLSLSDAATLRDACPDGACPPELSDTLSRRDTLAHVSTASFALAGVGAVLGVVGVVLSVGGDDTPDGDAEAELTVGPRSVTFTVMF